MTEEMLQSAVIECAQLLGWRVAHFRPAKTARGWRTPVAGDGVGFPDLVMCRGSAAAGRLLFVELKSASGRVADAQQSWLTALAAATFEAPLAEVHVWRPADWESGLIERTLRHPTLPRVDLLRSAA